LHYALSYDEEVGCLGVRGLIRDLEENGIRPAGCVVGEPTSMQPIIAHKGSASLSLLRAWPRSAFQLCQLTA